MANISHGRGGAGNIEPDTQTYTDGEIIREGVTGDQGDGPFSTGRGGAGNVGTPQTKAAGGPHDEEVIPEVALRDDQKDYHLGRGGKGNEVHNHPEGKHEHKGLGEKIKEKVMGPK